MVKKLHAACIEVLLDVVYNDTAEAGVDGPTLSFRGLGDACVLQAGSTDREVAASRLPTGTSPGAARRSTLRSHPPCGSGLAALLGAWRCTSTGSASI